MMLSDLVMQSARRSPDAVAIRGPEGAMSYGDLDRLANRLARAMERLGVRPGDRVGIWLDKSACCIAAMQASLRIGAAYVPLDPMSPATRVGIIVDDCEIRCVVTTSTRASAILGPAHGRPNVTGVCVSGERPEQAETWSGVTWADVLAFSDEPLATPPGSEHSLAYILYTSGSTGKPKGVCISHRNAWAFIEWAAAEVGATASDRFANHAPFHFDLSVLDLYVPFLVGGQVSLIPEGLAYAPRRLVEFVQTEAISVWYSVPSALVLMMDAGFLDLPAGPLRAILFAGEPFPIKHLRRLREHMPAVRLLNLYGPTETNVCTFHEVGEIAADRTLPVPIGRACSRDEVWAVKPDGSRAGVGEEGELMVAGETVMLGYWGHPLQGDRPYATGDLVQLQADGAYVYVGRRDHMVKVRGHRIELGEVEAALEQHPSIREVAVVVRGSGLEARLVAYVAPIPGAELSLLALKRQCAERLPRYMIIDDVKHVAALPRTRNGKVDRLALVNDKQSITEEV